MAQNDSGAIDHDFDDAARDPREMLDDELTGYNRAISGGDLAIDLIQGRPLYVRRRVADTVADYYDAEGFDVATYKTHPWLPVDVDDPVFECVFVPTKPQDLPTEKKSASYDYPRGRLARVPVEWLYNSETTPQDDFRIAVLAAMLSTAADADGDALETIHAIARSAFGDAAAFEAADRAGIDVRD